MAYKASYDLISAYFSDLISNFHFHSLCSSHIDLLADPQIKEAQPLLRAFALLFSLPEHTLALFLHC